MRRVIVDTCVIVDFLRGEPVPRLEELLKHNAVLISPYVRLELFAGVRRAERPILEELLRGVRQTPHRPEVMRVAERLLVPVKRAGLNVGLVDLLIAAEARLLKCEVFSFDGVFQKLSRYAV